MKAFLKKNKKRKKHVLPRALLQFVDDPEYRFEYEVIYECDY
jgi:hypothetical protein